MKSNKPTTSSQRSPQEEQELHRKLKAAVLLKKARKLTALNRRRLKGLILKSEATAMVGARVLAIHELLSPIPAGLAHELVGITELYDLEAKAETYFRGLCGVNEDN